MALSVGACRSEPPTSSAADASAPSPVLALERATHDFGAVDEGARLVHVFRAKNAGHAPLRLEPVPPAFGCNPEPWTKREVAPGASSELRVACETEKRAGALDVELVVKSNDPQTAAQKLRLRGRVEPKLAFDALVVGLETDFGVPVTREVRLRGKLAREAKLAELTLENPGPRELGVELVPADATRPMGVRFTLDGARVADGAGGLRVKTGVPGRDPLSLSFTYRVRGFIDVTPSRPYVNLRVPDEKVSVLFSSRRPGFELERVEIAEGPFHAELGAEHPGGGRYVLVSAKRSAVPREERGALGSLVIFSNDPAEPEKVVPLFALGTHTTGAPRAAASR